MPEKDDSGDLRHINSMSISTLFGSPLLSGIAALTLTGTLAGGTALAGAPAKHEVRDLHHELRDDSKAEREEISALRKQLAAEYAKENPDEAELRRLHEAIEAKRDLISEMRFETLLSMHDRLDAKQRERLAERIAGKGKPDGKGEGKGKGKGKDKDKPESERVEGKADAKGKGKDKAERGKGKDKGKDETDRRPI
jgi:hypothetical protein